MSFLGRVYLRHKFKQNIIFSKRKKNIFITTELCKASKVVSIALYLPLSFEQTESFEPWLKVAVNQWKSVVKYQEKLLKKIKNVTIRNFSFLLSFHSNIVNILPLSFFYLKGCYNPTK